MTICDEPQKRERDHEVLRIVVSEHINGRTCRAEHDRSRTAHQKFGRSKRSLSPNQSCRTAMLDTRSNMRKLLWENRNVRGLCAYNDDWEAAAEFECAAAGSAAYRRESALSDWPPLERPARRAWPHRKRLVRDMPSGQTCPPHAKYLSRVWKTTSGRPRNRREHAHEPQGIGARNLHFHNRPRPQRAKAPKHASFRREQIR